ncbi:MAG: dihydrofolate reductase [Chloroflexota bacterium]
MLKKLNGIRLTAVVAMDKNGVIGVNGDLPWRLPNDLKAFKRRTVNRPIIMGRKTFESIGRPLPKRTNIILTRSADYIADGCAIAYSVEEAIDCAMAHVGEENEIIIGGGGVIYSLFLPLLTDMVITFVDVELQGDAWFPEWNREQWEMIEQVKYAADERHAYPFEISSYKRVTLT